MDRVKRSITVSYAVAQLQGASNKLREAGLHDKADEASRLARDVELQQEKLNKDPIV